MYEKGIDILTGADAQTRRPTEEQVTHLSRNVPRTSPRPDLVLDPLDKLLRERLALEEFHKHDNALVGARLDKLSYSEAVDDGVCVMRHLWRETQIDHVVQLSRAKADSARIAVRSVTCGPSESGCVSYVGGRDTEKEGDIAGERKRQRTRGFGEDRTNLQNTVTPS